MSFWRTSRTTAVPGSITPHARHHTSPGTTAAAGATTATASPPSTHSSSSSSSSSSGILSTLAKTLSQTPVSTTAAQPLAKNSALPTFTSSVCAASEGTTPASSSSSSSSSPQPQCGSTEPGAAYAARVARFERVLAEPLVSIDALRRLAWRGVPAALRPLVWKLLLGIVPLSRARRAEVLASKRAEYRANVPTFMGAEKSEAECGTLHQIAIDLPRTAPGVAPFASPRVRALQERVLYIWALLHPASGYVQGLNELLTPIVLVLLSEYVPVFAAARDGTSTDVVIVQEADVARLTDAQFADIEADAYWCLAKLLESVQDSYTSGQPGIHRALQKLQCLLHRLDEPLEKHLEAEGVQLVQFAFRWMNCFLMRDLPMPLILRLWDTYMAEGTDGFSVFHIYLCAAFLVHWSARIRALQMPEILLFLQHLPTDTWRLSDLEDVIAQAFVYRSLYENSHHLSDT